MLRNQPEDSSFAVRNPSSPHLPTPSACKHLRKFPFDLNPIGVSSFAVCVPFELRTRAFPLQMPFDHFHSRKHDLRASKSFKRFVTRRHVWLGPGEVLGATDQCHKEGNWNFPSNESLPLKWALYGCPCLAAWKWIQPPNAKSQRVNTSLSLSRLSGEKKSPNIFYPWITFKCELYTDTRWKNSCVQNLSSLRHLLLWGRFLVSVA